MHSDQSLRIFRDKGILPDARVGPAPDESVKNTLRTEVLAQKPVFEPRRASGVEF